MPFGVYFHVPFCARRCDYCDFATWDDRAHLIDGYVDACLTELEGHQAGSSGLPAATSVFFGGGTPSLLPSRHLVRMLAAVDRTPDAEVTVEANPDSVDADKLAEYRDAGVTRLSLGVQSTVSRVLGLLGRTHDPTQVEHAFGLARAAGFAHLNADLIYGVPGETAGEWLRALDDVISLGVGHVSAYALTVEPATPLGRRVAAGQVPAPEDDVQAGRYERADDLLAGAGLEWYEVSNWARPGEECRHNLLYWAQGEYVGIGCAAHSHLGGRRWWNVRTPERYRACLAAGECPEAGSETLDRRGRAEEAFALALRTRRGAELAAPAHGVAAGLAGDGLLGFDGRRAVLTRRGRLLATDLTARLLLAGAAGP